MLKTILTQTRLIHLRDSFLSLVFYIVGSLMPVWLSIALLVLISQPIGVGTFLDNGQFAIYGAAAAAPLLYLLIKDNPGPEHIAYFLLILIGLFLTVAIFSGLIVVEVVERLSEHLSVGKLNIKINLAFLRWLSVAIYGVALAATFFVDLHENVYQAVNMSEGRQQRQDTLDEQFESAMMSSGD